MAHTTQHAAGSRTPRVGHLVGVRTLLATLIALLVLTGLTYYSARYIKLGDFNIWLALVIATIKAAIVCMYFMHLRWDRPFNVLVLITSLVLLMLFVGLSLTDTRAYQGEIDWKPADFYAQQAVSK
jgi:cytochrome c oxidase subunit IV